jgi:hypothetical protein
MELAHDEHWETRSGVAWNPNTPSDVVIELARDKDYHVRWNIAANVNAPPLVLAELAQEGPPFLRDSVAGNPNTPLAVLIELAQIADVDPGIPWGIWTNVNASPQVLVALARHSESRGLVASHPNTPPSLLAELAQQADCDARHSATINPNIILEDLVPPGVEAAPPSSTAGAAL